MSILKITIMVNSSGRLNYSVKWWRQSLYMHKAKKNRNKRKKVNLQYWLEFHHTLIAASRTKTTNEQSTDVDDKQCCQPPEVTDT